MRPVIFTNCYSRLFYALSSLEDEELDVIKIALCKSGFETICNIFDGCLIMRKGGQSLEDGDLERVLSVIREADSLTGMRYRAAHLPLPNTRMSIRRLYLPPPAPSRPNFFFET